MRRGEIQAGSLRLDEEAKETKRRRKQIKRQKMRPTWSRSKIKSFVCLENFFSYCNCCQNVFNGIFQNTKEKPSTARSSSRVFHGAPNRIRTCGLLIRRLSLTFINENRYACLGCAWSGKEMCLESSFSSLALTYAHLNRIHEKAVYSCENQK